MAKSFRLRRGTGQKRTQKAMIDLDTIGYFLFMEEQEKKEQEASQQSQEEEDTNK